MTRRPPEILRTAHGNGAEALLRAETPVLDERPPLNAADTAQGLTMAARRGRPFTPGNRAAQGRRPGLCLLGVPLDAADPRYRSALRKANTYRQRRVRETAVAHGGYLGAGPAAMFASSARALAASIVLSTLAGEALARADAKAASALFATAARLDDYSRQQELTATALAEREAEARKKLQASRDPVADMRSSVLGGER